MKKLVYTTLIAAFIAVSCKNDSENPLRPGETPPIALTIEEEINNLPEIRSGNVEHAQIKKIDATLVLHPNGGTTRFNLNLDYFEDGKMKSISDRQGQLYNFEYNSQKLELSSGELQTVFKLKQNGLAESDNKETVYYYKNNFLIHAISGSKSTYSYSPDGDLLTWNEKLGGNSATYTYTKFENNIRQEVLDSDIFHWTFRDAYLGNFSTHLIKSAKFTDPVNGITTLDFDYVFDDQGRVEKIIVDRKRLERPGTGTIEYTLTY